MSAKNYRTEIPNIIDDLGLDPHESALYRHYKRSCGDNGEWVESLRLTGKRTKMSYARVSLARNSLVKKGLIKTYSKGNDGTAVRIVDIWGLNKAYYDFENRPDIDGWSIDQLTKWCTGVYIINTLQQDSPNNEDLGEGVNNTNASVHNINTSVNNINNKKEQKEKTIKNNDNDNDFGKICKSWESNIGFLSPILADNLKDYLTKCPADWIVYAIGVATEAGGSKRNWRYIKKILDNWLNLGYPDLPEFRQQQKEIATEAAIVEQKTREPETPGQKMLNQLIARLLPQFHWANQFRYIDEVNGIWKIGVTGQSAEWIRRERVKKRVNQVASSLGIAVPLEFVNYDTS